MAITFKHASLVCGMATDSARTDSFGLSLTVLPKQTGKNSVCELLSAINTNPGDVFFFSRSLPLTRIIYKYGKKLKLAFRKQFLW